MQGAPFLNADFSQGNAGPPQVSLTPAGAGWAQPGPGGALKKPAHALNVTQGRTLATPSINPFSTCASITGPIGL